MNKIMTKLKYPLLVILVLKYFLPKYQVPNILITLIGFMLCFCYYGFFLELFDSINIKSRIGVYLIVAALFLKVLVNASAYYSDLVNVSVVFGSIFAFLNMSYILVSIYLINRSMINNKLKYIVVCVLFFTVALINYVEMFLSYEAICEIVAIVLYIIIKKVENGRNSNIQKVSSEKSQEDKSKE